MGLSLSTHTQLLAQQPKWAIHNSIVDYQNGVVQGPLPTLPDPDYTQNAVWDANDNLVMYQADGKIFNASGGLILDMVGEVSNLYSDSPNILGFTEFIFVPVPGECGLYYGITTYSDGSLGINYINDIVWCEIDLTIGTGTAIPLSTGYRVAKESVKCEGRSVETEEKRDYQIHIEITRPLSTGNRYLFSATRSCISVLDVTSAGISLISGYDGGGIFFRNLRSEMEVYQDESVYEIAMSFYSNIPLQGTSNVTIFKFDMSNPAIPVISHYYIGIPGEQEHTRVVKGLEYSLDGLTLYTSIMTIYNTYSSVVPGNKKEHLRVCRLYMAV